MAYPDGKPEKIADQAFWPRLSKDGSRLAYITSDIHSGKNKLVLADPDGKNAQVVMMSGPLVPEILDAPNFAPDGQSDFVQRDPLGRGGSTRLVGHGSGGQGRHAHEQSSEWWSVPLAGGKVDPADLPRLHGPVCQQRAGWDRYIAVYSANGLFIMKPDASAFFGLIQNLGGISAR